MSGAALGAALLAASSLAFAYVSVWLLALPFVDADQVLHAFFPPRHVAVALVALAISLVVAAVSLFLAKTLLLGDRKKARGLKRWTHCA